MNQEVGTSQKLSKASIALGIYFLLLPTDCFRIGAVGSLLKVYAFVPIAFLFLSGGMRRLILDRLLSRLLLFLLIAALSALWSMDFDVTVSSVRSLALNILFAVLMAGTYQYTEKEAGFLLKCLVASSWITVIGMLLFGSSSELGRLTLVIGDSEQDPNYVTGYIVFAFAYHFTAFLKQRKFLHLFPTAAIMIVIILTGSRGGLAAYLACAFFAVVYGIQSSKHPVRVAVLAAAAAVLAYFVFSAAMQIVDVSISSRFSLQYLLDHGTTGRSKIWIHLLKKFRGASIGWQLFGHGYGMTRYLNTLSGSFGGLVAHNLYIDNLMSIGIIGLLAQLALQFQCVKAALRSKNSMLVCAYGAFLVMTLSLSLTNYKPIWSAMLMITILNRVRDD